MTFVKELTTEQQWHELLEASLKKPVLVFKHSTTCPISAEAHSQFEAFVEEHGSEDVHVSLVKVIESRSISNLIAEEVNVKHESPQLIIVKDKKVHWSNSHWNITKKNIENALKR